MDQGRLRSLKHYCPWNMDRPWKCFPETTATLTITATSHCDSRLL